MLETKHPLCFYIRFGHKNPKKVINITVTINIKAPKSVFDAWRRIVSEEGIMALWTGCGPTIGRAMVVNVCQLCCQTQAKEEIAKRTLLKEGYLLSFFGAMIAGFINSCVSLPIDIAKTRLQNMKVMHNICQKGTLIVFSQKFPFKTIPKFHR